MGRCKGGQRAQNSAEGASQHSKQTSSKADCAAVKVCWQSLRVMVRVLATASIAIGARVGRIRSRSI
jgi:hypothetical protein